MCSSDLTKIRGTVSNIAAVERAVAALAQAIDSVQAIKRQALLHAQVTAALHAPLAEIRPALEPLALNVIRLNEAGDPVLAGARNAAELNALAADAGRNLYKPIKG